MKALIYEGPKDVKMKEVEKPKIGSDEVLIKTKFVAICGSDMSIFKGTFPVRNGIILGHEGSGVVEKVGSDVRNAKPGDEVILAPFDFCGECVPCRAGRYNVCRKRVHVGIDVDGLLAEYFKLPSHAVYPLPKGMNLEEGALVEPASVGYHAVRRASPTPSDTVVILGAGPIGLLVLQGVAAFGSQKIIVSELIDKRAKLAEKLGAHRVVNPKKENLQEVVMKETDGEGADIAIEAVGSPDTIAQTVGLVRSAGRICLVGIPSGSLSFDFRTLVRREIDIVTSDATLMSYEKTHELVAKKIIDVRPLISHTLDFKDVLKAFDILKDQQDAIKVMIKFPD
jgi:L-iditol 2-dehydrogenase